MTAGIDFTVTVDRGYLVPDPLEPARRFHGLLEASEVVCSKAVGVDRELKRRHVCQPYQ